MTYNRSYGKTIGVRTELAKFKRRELAAIDAAVAILEEGGILSANALAKRKKWGWRRANKTLLQAESLGYAKQMRGGWVKA